MKQKTIKTPRGQVSYWVEGNRIRPRLLLLHGAMMDHRMFYNQAIYFRDNYFLIMPDLPAHGQSRPYEDFSFSNTVEDLLTILDEEKVRHTHVLGHSMGGYIAQELYRWAPDLVKSLVCASSAPLNNETQNKKENPSLGRSSAFMKLAKKERLIEDIVRRNTLTPRSAQYTRDILQQYKREELFMIMAIINRDSRSADEISVHCPFLIMVGESDNNGNVKENAQLWANNTNADYREVPLAAHMLNVDNSGSFNLILQNWLNSIQ